LKNLREFSSVIISTPPEFTLLTVPIIKLFGKKLIIDVGDLPIDLSESTHSIRNNRIVKKILHDFQINCWKKASLVITNSNVVTKEITKLVKDPQKIKYFPFNVNPNFFKKHNYPHSNRIIYTGMMSPAQNIEAFIESMAIVVKKIPELEFDIFGWGKSSESIQELIIRHKLEKHCRINKPIPREEIPELLSKYLVGLIPLNAHKSLRYAMPTKSFEYMSCGLPIFSYGSSEEMEEMIKKSEAGIFVKSNDPEELATRLIDFLSNKESLDLHSSKGRHFIEKKMDYSDLLHLI
jgi:glycosyltransferase involved in cell wall biosynthesis